ncbi:MAG: OPT/YSL family transporter [Alphaproteobacteria bacterium]|nr:OPT/YSL family transporter [Alphaproteobacteria bacterium]
MSDEPTATAEDQPLYTPHEGEAQLTFRAVATGCTLGGIVCAMNIYFGLQTGWSIGGSLIAAILGFSFFRVVTGITGGEPLTRLEVNIAQTAGSAAGSMTSAAGLLAPIPALRILDQRPLSYFELTLWAASVAWLGVFFAVPLRRQMVLVERLRFPTGTATANTILAMFSEGADALKKSQYMLAFALAAGLFTLANHFFGELSHPPLEEWIPIAILTVPASYSILLYNSPLMWGAGVLIGPRVAISLLVGALFAWGFLAPFVEWIGWRDRTYVTEALLVTAWKGHFLKPAEVVALADPTGALASTADFLTGVLPRTPRDATMDYEHGARGWVLWPGVAIMVADALTSLALSWRTILNTFTGAAASGGSDGALDTSDSSEMIPNSWWMGGLAAAATLTVVSAWYLFAIHPLMTVLAVALSSVLAAIAVRSTGETDINPIGGMGKVTQLVYGGIAPGSVTTNLMTAAITGSGASQAGDMMQDLKTGWLLGASPRKQIIAQLSGITAGIFVCVPIFLLFDAAWDIGGVGELDAAGKPLKSMPAPAAHAWAGMARVLAQGLDALPTNAEYAVLCGLAFGIAVPVIRKYAKNPVWLPSGLAVGVAFIVHAYFSIAMFAGMVAFQIWRRVDTKSADSLGFAVASGLIAGEGLTGVVTAVLQVLGIDRAWLMGLFG